MDVINLLFVQYIWNVSNLISWWLNKISELQFILLEDDTLYRKFLAAFNNQLTMILREKKQIRIAQSP